MAEHANKNRQWKATRRTLRILLLFNSGKKMIDGEEDSNVDWTLQDGETGIFTISKRIGDLQN